MRVNKNAFRLRAWLHAGPQARDNTIWLWRLPGAANPNVSSVWSTANAQM